MFAKAALNKKLKKFVIYIVVLNILQTKIVIHFSKVAKIIIGKSMQIAGLKQNKVSTKVLTKYFDFTNVFLEEKILVLLK